MPEACWHRRGHRKKLRPHFLPEYDKPGFLPVECPAAVDAIANGDTVCIDIDAGVIRVYDKVFAFISPPVLVQQILKSGGLVPYTTNKKQLEEGRYGENFAEKILSLKSTTADAVAGQIVDAIPDLLVCDSGSTPLLSGMPRKSGSGRRLIQRSLSSSLTILFRRNPRQSANNHKIVREFVREYGVPGFFLM